MHAGSRGCSCEGEHPSCLSSLPLLRAAPWRVRLGWSLWEHLEGTSSESSAHTQQNIGSVVSLAFLASFKSCFLLKEKKKKKSPSAERSLGCGARGAVGTYYSFPSVLQALDDSSLGPGAVSQPYTLSLAPSETADCMEGVSSFAHCCGVAWHSQTLLSRRQAGKDRALSSKC